MSPDFWVRREKPLSGVCPSLQPRPLTAWLWLPSSALSPGHSSPCGPRPHHRHGPARPLLPRLSDLVLHVALARLCSSWDPPPDPQPHLPSNAYGGSFQKAAPLVYSSCPWPFGGAEPDRTDLSPVPGPR